MTPELRALLARLKLSKILDTLPERFSLARQQKMSYEDLMTLVLADEVSRRDATSAELRAAKAKLDPTMVLESWDPEAKVVYDKRLWNELTTLRFVDEHHHVSILGQVGVGKTHLASALGHIACRRRLSVAMVSCEKMLRSLKHSRLDGSYEQELRRLVSVDLLLVDDFALDALDSTESRDMAEIITERHRSGSIVLTSNRAPEEWLSVFSEPMRAQSAVDRLHNNSYDLVIEGESYRKKLKPGRSRGSEGKEKSKAG